MDIKTALPADVFTADIEGSYKTLAKRYHPDADGTNEEFIALQALKALALAQLKDGYLVGSHGIYVTYTNSVYAYTYSVPFELGTLYVGYTQLIYILTAPPPNEGIPPIVYPSKTGQEVLCPQIPRIAYKKPFYIIPKRDNFVSIASIIYLDIPVETSIWILNRLLSLACLLDHNEYVHLDISGYTVFVDLEHHNIGLYGGWWYTTKKGEKITQLPARTYGLLSRGAKTTNIAQSSIMVDQIKLLIKEIKKDRKFPNIYENWLTLPSGSDIIQEYSEWETVVLPKIFPTRKFYKWP